MKKIKLYAIGNAHLDPVWLWDWQEGCSETISTFRSAVDRLKEYPEFVFTAGGAIYYQWIKKLDPELFREIKKYVKSGRWSIVNGWWLQPDCNLPSGESFVRQCLYGKRYFKKEFNIDVEVGYNVDSFGHNAILPQILKKTGFKYYIFFRPVKHEKELPGTVFWWQSKDGSKVLACRPPINDKKSFYCTHPNELTEIIDEIKSILVKNNESEGLFFYGVGNHGGGPTKKNIESIRNYNKTSQDVEIEFSSIEKHFQSITKTKKSFPVLADELQHTAVGCYTSHSQVKSLNRKSEISIYVAELLSSLAYKFFGYKYPYKELTDGWKMILFNQFHDILAGSAIKKGYDIAVNSYEYVLYQTRNIINETLRRIINKTLKPEITKTSLASGTINIFNPLSWPVDGHIKLHLFPYDWSINEYVVDDSAGNTVPVQMVRGESVIRRELLLYVKNIPACGLKTLFWKTASSPLGEEDKGEGEDNYILTITENILENKFWELTIDNETGFISSLYDKINKVEVFRNLSNIPVIVNDQSDSWGNQVTSYPDEIGQFIKTKIVIDESGPVRAILRVVSEYNKSTFEQEIVLCRYTDKIDFRTRIYWQEKFKMLRMKFDLNLDNVKVTSSIPYGYIERNNNGSEEVCQHWIDVSGETTTQDGKPISYGVGFINDSRYAYDVNNNIVRLSLLRSPVYAWGIDIKIEDDKSYDFIDQGEHIIIYQIFPHKEYWDKTDLVNRAYELNIPLEVITYTYSSDITIDDKMNNLLYRNSNKATLKVCPTKNNVVRGFSLVNLSFISIEPKTIILTALKKCENDNSLILRFVETIGRDTKAIIKFGFLNQQLRFKINHHEIKTYKFSFNIRTNRITFHEVNLLEK